MKKRIKINGLVIFCCVVLIAAFPFRFLRITAGRLNAVIDISGFALMLSGMLLRVSSRGYKSENSKEGGSLVSGGPYALARNPMYLGILAIGTGMIMLLFQWWVLAVFIAFLLLRYLTLIFQEEGQLRQHFGQAYIDYQQRVPRLFPRPADLIKADIRKYLPLKLDWIKREANSIPIVILASLGLKYWERIAAGNQNAIPAEFTGLFLVMGIFTLLVIFLSRRHENIAK